MRLPKSRPRPVGPDAKHQVISDDATAHVPANHEREASEHLPFRERTVLGHDLRDPFCQFLVVCHP